MLDAYAGFLDRLKVYDYKIIINFVPVERE